VILEAPLDGVRERYEAITKKTNQHPKNRKVEIKIECVSLVLTQYGDENIDRTTKSGRMKIPEQPNVTIAIPTYNRVTFLKKAVDSALEQTYKNIEIIVSDNASSDNTLELLTSYDDDRLIVIRQETNIGMIRNWNACLAKATGELFLLLSDDDFLEPTAIEEMSKVFTCGHAGVAAGDIGIAYCRSRIIDETGTTSGYGERGSLVESAASTVQLHFQCKRSVPLCATIIRTSDIRLLGGYDAEQFPLAADAKVWMMASLKHGVVAYIDKVLANYRIHTLNVTSEVKVDDWIKENAKLAQMCINYFSTQGDKQSAKSIEQFIVQYNARAIDCLIQRAAKGKKEKFSFIKQYSAYSRYFLGLYGIPLIFKGILRICLPHSVVIRIKQIRSILQR